MACQVGVVRVESVVQMLSDLLYVNFVHWCSFHFVFLNFTATMVGYLASAIALTEGFTFLFGALTDKFNMMHLCDLVSDQSTELYPEKALGTKSSLGQSLGSTSDFGDVTTS